MSVSTTARFPDDVHAAFKEYCDRVGSNPSAEIVTAVRKHIGMPTTEERIEAIEIGLKDCINRLNKLEQTNAIATPQFSDSDTQSSQND